MMFLDNHLGYINDIISFITIFRKRIGLSEKFAIPGMYGSAENNYLVPFIIKIIFSHYLMPRKLQYISKDIAHRGLPAMRYA